MLARYVSRKSGTMNVANSLVVHGASVVGGTDQVLVEPVDATAISGQDLSYVVFSFKLLQQRCRHRCSSSVDGAQHTIEQALYRY